MRFLKFLKKKAKKAPRAGGAPTEMGLCGHSPDVPDGNDYDRPQGTEAVTFWP